MKLNAPWLTNLAGLLASSLLQRWMSTIEHKIVHYDPTNDPAHPDNSVKKLYIFWHEYIALPICQWGNCNVTILLSQHRDADMLARAAHHLGFDHIRGSTFGGATQALRQLLRLSKRSNLAWGCDGPRGPRRTLGQGPIYLSSKLRMPLVPIGFGYDRPWRVNSWDRFAIPRLGSRARCVFGPAITLPPNLDREGIEHYRQVIEQLITRLTNEAEAWAESGTTKLNQQPMLKQAARSKWRRLDSVHVVNAPHSGVPHSAWANSQP